MMLVLEQNQNRLQDHTRLVDFDKRTSI